MNEQFPPTDAEGVPLIDLTISDPTEGAESEHHVSPGAFSDVLGKIDWVQDVEPVDEAAEGNNVIYLDRYRLSKDLSRRERW